MSVKRLLDCTPSELARYTKAELLDAIAGSEGRVLACETIGLTPPLLVDVTNAEYAASLSADILLLNMFDVQHPVINALTKVPEVETVRELKRLTGRVVGINLEPCDLQAAKSNDGTLWKMSGGRLATVENARRAAEMGVDLIVLTGNPGNGVSNELIVEALKAISAAVGDRVLLAAGKMHASGVAGEGGEKIMTPADAEALGLKQGDWAWIETKYGKIRECVDIYYGIGEGVVNLEHAWWFPELSAPNHGEELCNCNRLLNPDNVDPIMASPCMRGFMVKIYKATPENSPFGNPIPCDTDGTEIIHDATDPRLKEWLPDYSLNGSDY